MSARFHRSLPVPTSIALGITAFLVMCADRDSRLNHRCSECNVILISIDTLRHDHLGCMGYHLNITPHIDDLASDGVLFAQAVSQAPSTLPAHAAMLTSLIPPHHGAYYARGTRLPRGFPTLATILGVQGFRTVSFNGGAQISPAYGVDQGFELYETFGGKPFSKSVSRALAWLSDHRGERFLMFLHTYEAHYPFTPNRAFLKRIEPRYSGTLPARIDKELLMRINNGTRPITREDESRIVAAYDAEIISVDAALGVLVDSLRALELYDNSLVIFTGDHGEEFREHGMMGWHGHTMYDELLRVPLIMKLPGSLFGGIRVKDQVRHIDIAPTILDVVDLEPPASFEGSSLIPVVRDASTLVGKGSNRRRGRISIAQKDMGPNGYIKALRTPEWKLVVHERRGAVERVELYDLQSDRRELSDLSEGSVTVRDSLLSIMGDMISAREIPEPEHAVLTDTTTSRLRALGYIE